MKRKALSLLLAMVLCVGLIGCAAPGKAETPDEQGNNGEIAADLLASEAVKPVPAEALAPSTSAPSATKLSTSSGAGLDKSGADALYKQLSAYNGQGYDVLYADLKDMDADGIPELVVVSTNGYNVIVIDIWQVKNGNASKVTSTECEAMMHNYIGYATNGGKTYVCAWTNWARMGEVRDYRVFLTTGGYIEEFTAYGYMTGEDTDDFLADGEYTRTVNGQTSDITGAEYNKYQSAYVMPQDDVGFLEDTSWASNGGNGATYQTVLNQLSAVKDTTGSTSSTGSTNTTTGFTDVSASAYYAESVAWAIQKGITNGTGNNQFSPNQNCTNAQILTFLWRAYGQPEPTISNPFTNNITEAYRKAAIWAYEKGMVSGRTFDADKLCTRAMAVTYMWQAAGSPATSTGGSSYGSYTISGTNGLGPWSVVFSSASVKTATVTLCTDEDLSAGWDGTDIRHSPNNQSVTLVTVPASSTVTVRSGSSEDYGENFVGVVDYYPDSNGVYHTDPHITDVSMINNTYRAEYPYLISTNGVDYLVVPTSDTGPSGTFSDVPSNASYAQAVTWAVANGITNGTSDTAFSPNNVCTRAQIVTFLYRNLA